MTVLDCILDGIEAELALERELGVRIVECDRTLLSPLASKAAPAMEAAPPLAPAPESRPSPVRPPNAPARAAADYDFVFLHDRPLSAGGLEMMNKIVFALGATPETAPVVFEGGLPSAQAYVVLGGNALKKWFPGVSAAPGQWVSAERAPNVLVTYSPAYILRFGVVTPAVKRLKQDMWQSLKSVRQRLKLRTAE